MQCVDTEDDPTNCGDCGITCVVPHASAVCNGGICGLGQCDALYGDCDDDPANGCETALEQGKQCGQTCDMEAEVCNVKDDNCNGACDEGAGCRIGVHRSVSATFGHVYTTDLNEAKSDDLVLEFENYYYLYHAAQTGLVPFHRCKKGNNKNFYTVSGSCEGGGALIGVIGQIAKGTDCGATPLYRLYNGNSGDHFYTTSAGERDNAVSMYGYSYENIAGYVWTGP